MWGFCCFGATIRTFQKVQCLPYAGFSKHQPFGPMLSISRFVRTYVCLSVRLFTFEVPFNGLFALTSRSRMSNILRDSESLNIFVWNWSKIAKQKKSFFWRILPYKTWWKPRFPMDQRPLVEGSIANFGIFLDVFQFLRFG